MAVRTHIEEIANTTATVTTGATFDLVTQRWHEPYLSLFLSIGGTGEVDIQFSADDTNWVDGKDILGNSLADLTVSGYHMIPGRVRHIRANVPAVAGGTILVQVQKEEKS